VRGGEAFRVVGSDVVRWGGMKGIRDE